MGRKCFVLKRARLRIKKVRFSFFVFVFVFDRFSARSIDGRDLYVFEFDSDLERERERDLFLLDLRKFARARSSTDDHRCMHSFLITVTNKTSIYRFNERCINVREHQVTKNDADDDDDDDSS